MNIFLFWILNITSLLLGYALGLGKVKDIITSRSGIVDIKGKITGQVKKKTKDRRIGAIKHISQEALNKEGTTLKEEEEAMTEVIKEKIVK